MPSRSIPPLWLQNWADMNNRVVSDYGEANASERRRVPYTQDHEVRRIPRTLLPVCRHTRRMGSHMSASIPPRWLVNWCALNGMDVIGATTQQRRGDWYVFRHNTAALNGFYVWKSITRERFLVSHAARNPYQNYHGTVGRTNTIGDQIATNGKTWSAPKLA